jgi:hypothetical protein
MSDGPIWTSGDKTGIAALLTMLFTGLGVLASRTATERMDKANRKALEDKGNPRNLHRQGGGLPTRPLASASPDKQRQPAVPMTEESARLRGRDCAPGDSKGALSNKSAPFTYRGQPLMGCPHPSRAANATTP